MKKNPVFELKDAHGERGLGSHPHYWITSVACVPFSDIVASGESVASLSICLWGWGADPLRQGCIFPAV